MTSRSRYSKTIISESTVSLAGHRSRQQRFDIDEAFSLTRVLQNYSRRKDENEFKGRNLTENIADEQYNTPYKTIKLDFDGEINILDNSAAKHKLSVRPKRKYADSRQRFATSTQESSASRTSEEVSTRSVRKIHGSDRDQDHEEASCKREAVVKELLETEEEFCRDLTYVLEHYIKPSDGFSVPEIVRNNTEILFSNFKQITNFHNTVLFEGIKYYSDEPRMIGKTFLRLERDFDKHIIYCRDVASALEFISDNSRVADFFEELSQKLGDSKSILEYLKLPVQRINDYQVLLKDLVKYSERLGENANDLKKALDLMLAVPQKANDNKFLNNIEGYHGNIHNLGRLLRHDWFTVDSTDDVLKERYLFLFKDQILICKVKKISEDRSVFSLKDLIPLSQVRIEVLPNNKGFELIPEGDSKDGRIKVCPRKEEATEFWLNEIRKFAPAAFEKPEETEICQISESRSPKDSESIDDLIQDQKKSVVEKEKQPKITEPNEISDESQEQKMSRRLSTRRSTYKTYEESYSISGQQESYSHSRVTSTSRYSSLSTRDSKVSIESYGETSAISFDSSKSGKKSADILAIGNGDAPIFTKKIGGQHLEPGDTAVFECQLDSDGKITWLKNNKPLEDKLTERIVRSSTDDFTHRLEIQHVSETDSGTYTALAESNGNVVTCTAQLMVDTEEDSKRKGKEGNGPSFTVSLKDSQLMENTNFAFFVKVKGNPNPDVQFYKDGALIRSKDDDIRIDRTKSDVGFYELDIPSVRRTHAGVYSCRAANEFGEAHCEALITVITDEKDIFKGLEKDALLTPGEKPSFAWFKDGKSFEPDERFKVLLGNEDDSLALIFQHVKPDDAGLYTCVASTTTGKISCSAELSVQGSVSPLSRQPEKPKITRETRTEEAQAGSSATLEAKVLGFPRPDVKWFHEGEEIKAEGRYKFLYDEEETITLVIKNVNPKDGGSYKIVAKNELGEACTELDLIVKGAPKFLKKMEDVEVNVQESLKITTAIEGSPTPDVKWFKDGKEIKESERIKIVKDSSSNFYELTIEKATKQDGGCYLVEASNEVNKCSDSCQVRVRSSPEIKKKMEKNVEVSEGDEISLEIQVSSEDSNAKIKWMKDGIEIIPDNDRIKISAEGDVSSLKILNASVKDSATYSVEVTNEFGTTKDEGKIKVKTQTCAPVIKKGLSDSFAKEGDVDFEFSVEVAAYPKPKIKWYVDGMEITEKRKEFAKVEEDNNYKLIVKKVTTELKGNYKCKVENDAGSAETTAKLTVQSKPIFAKSLEPRIAVDEGADLTLEVECSGCPEPEVSWFKDGEQIQTDAHIKIVKDSHRTENYSMTLTLIRAIDSGDYEARATNCMGSATTKTYVEVFSKITETSQDDVEGKIKKEKVEESQTTAILVQDEGEDKVSSLRSLKPKLGPKENIWTGITVEEIEENCSDRLNALSPTQGIIEEYSEHEVKVENRLGIDRGVSIVSLSEDERTISRNDSGSNLQEKNEEEEEEENVAADGENIPAREKLATDSEDVEKEEEEPRRSFREPDTLKKSDLWESPEEEVNEMDVTPELKREPETSEHPEGNKDKPIEAAEEDDSGTQPKTQKGDEGNEETGNEVLKDVKKVPDEVPLPDRDSDLDDDPVVRDLLKRIKKQRSVLDDILTKEEESQNKGEQQKPKFKEPLEDQKCLGKESVSFKCVVTSNEEPEMTWMRNGKEIVIDGSRIKVEKKIKKATEKTSDYTFILKISEASEADAGLYLARAKNKYGYDESSASLTVEIQEDETQDEPVEIEKPEKLDKAEKHEKPDIKKLKDMSTVLNEDVVFEAEVSSQTPVEVKWLDKDGKEIRGDDRMIITEDSIKGIYKLKIIKTSLDEIGEYCLVATNEAGSSKKKAKLSVNGEKPSFVKLLEDADIMDGSCLNLQVRCNGIPKPEVKWFKNGKELGSDDRIKVQTQTEGQVSSFLNIEKFEADDAAEYEVRATNVIGSAENKFRLKLAQVAPTFEKGLPRMMDSEDVLELKCKVTGSPKPQLSWLKDGRPLEPCENIKMEDKPDGSTKLVIENLEPGDTGNYSLVAENPSGTITGTCAVTVEPKSSKPKFLEGLKDQKGVAGEPLKLTAKISSYPPPEIKWFKDGRPLRPSQATQSFNEKDGKLELVFNSLKPEDAGTISVKVSNRLGEATQEAQIEVAEPLTKPSFDSVLKPVSAVEGSPAKFSVKASGNPKPTIKWYRNGEEVVPDGERVTLRTEPDSSVSLLINKCVPEDEGEYSAEAVNDQGKVSCRAPLTVLSKKSDGISDAEPSFVGPLNNEKVDEGSDVVLTAPISGNPIPEVIWEKDGKPLKLDDRILPTCDGKKVKLEIKSSKPSDSGLYSCHLRNPLGEARSQGNLNVRKIFKEPVFEEKFKDSQQEMGTDCKFVARISGNPKPEVQWYVNGEPIVNGDKYRMACDGDKYSLRINDCQPRDVGLYRCSASNRAGKADCVAQLDVVAKRETQTKAEPPSFLKKICDCDVYKGMTAKFTACCSGFPNPDFEWFRNGERLHPDHRIKMESEGNGLIRLIISGVDDKDIGDYRLRIFNQHGEAECSARLSCDVIESKSKRPVADKQERRPRPSGVASPLADRPIISRMMDRHLTLSWKPYVPLGPHPPVTYIVEMCKKPDGDWFTARRGIRSCACDIRNLEPLQDYKFRIRIENKYGISDPSPHAETFRQKIIPDLPKFQPYLSPGIDFRPETSPYFPKDFDLERPPHDRYEQAPKFLSQEHDTQYGIKGQNSNLFWFVYGYPKPTMTYYFNDEPIDMGGRYESSYTRNGQATLFINKMLDRDVGVYEAVAKNIHGEARQRVRLEIAEHPVFIRRPEETHIPIRGSGELVAKIFGVPEPEVKWYKDWQPLAQSSRIKIQKTGPDTFVLTIKDAIFKDEGLYSVSATNVAGSVSTSVMVHIEENEEAYKYATYGGDLNIKKRSEPYSNYYDIGDELGRGTQGIIYHAVDRRTGQNYAAKFMHGQSELKAFMLNELNIMNEMNHRKLVRLHDCFETKDLLVLIMELADGGQLVEYLTKQTTTTEWEIAEYIRQILWGLDYMHTRGYAHLSLSLNDLLISRPGGDGIKICDFGLSRRIAKDSLYALNYGMPEFMAPEVVNGDGVGYAADLWSLGIITYILLSGISPFRGSNDRETLTRIKEGKWKFDEDYFLNISSEARDFISRLLAYSAEDRMDVKTALQHPWLEKMRGPPKDPMPTIDITRLRDYRSSLAKWYENANCRTTYRREPNSNAFTHPSKMIYIPGKDYTPEPEVPAKATKKSFGRPPGDVKIPARPPLDYEVGNFKSESQYQYGPDTYLLQLRDVDLPCRLRRYMKVAADRQHSFSVSEPPDNHIDFRTPVIRERRKYMDIMDEEIEDEKRYNTSHHGLDEAHSIRRLKHEVGYRSDGRAEAEAMLEYQRSGQLPFFREKPQNLAIVQNKPAEMSCLVVGDPQPTVQWFKNDLVLAETSRIKFSTDENKRVYLKLDPALQSDAGSYKIVARNKIGQTTARMRIVVATVPLSPDAPEVVETSDKEVLLQWKHESDDVFTPIVCYSLQYKKSDDSTWIDIAKNIDHEFWLVRDLEPETEYDFRLFSRNCAGWSAAGLPATCIRTKEQGCPKVNISNAHRQIQSQTESRDGVTVAEESKPDLHYEIEDVPLDWSEESAIEVKYEFKSEICRGRYSTVIKSLEKESKGLVVAKLFDVSPEREEAIQREFDNLRSLRHERIVALISASRPSQNVAVFVMEKLQGADILSYFASRKEYNEDMVVTALIQVLDGLQYLHWRGLCHLDLQPDNIVLSTARALQFKLVDFGSARKVSKLGTIVDGPDTEFTAPEVLSQEPAFPQTDIWSLGAVAYVLLSGVSPFKGPTKDETQQNIIFVRYRFEHLYKELTQEATRFLMQIFKRTPSKRPTVEECYESRWLLSSEFIIRKRQKAAFPGSRLKEYNEEYHRLKAGESAALSSLGRSVGEKTLRKSESIQEELIDTLK